MCFSSLSAFTALVTATGLVWEEDGWTETCLGEKGQTVPGPSQGSGQRGCPPDVHSIPTMTHRFREGYRNTELPFDPGIPRVLSAIFLLKGDM
jgi:hypothetical protein